MNFINTILNNTTAYEATAKQLTANLRAVYSMDIMWQALPLMVWYQFAMYKEELKEQPGLTISMMSYNDLSRGNALVEGTPMTTDALTGAMKSITVTEHGKAVAVTELALQASFTNLMNDIVKALSRNVALTLDLDIRDVACAGDTINGKTTSIIYGRADSTVTKVTDKASVTSAHVFSMAVINDAVEILGTNDVPKFENSYYVCIIDSHQLRVLRDDKNWQEVTKYAQPEQFLNGEVGRINDVRFCVTSTAPRGDVPTTHVGYDASLKGTGAAGINLHKAMFFGEDYYGVAVGLPVELRDGGVIDLGRNHVMGWYSIYGSKVLNPERAVIAITA